jgi:hypothetical protein
MEPTNVLTTASSVTCADQAPATTPSEAKLRVGQKPVLLFEDLPGAKIPTCPVTSSGTTKCTSIDKLLTGKAAKLRVGPRPADMKAVALETLAGITDGKTSGVPRTVSAKAGQTRLRAE